MVQIFKWQISSCSAFQAISARLRPEEILPPERWHFALSCRVFKPYSFQISEKTAVLQVSKMLLIGIFLTCLQVWGNLTWSALSPPPGAYISSLRPLAQYTVTKKVRSLYHTSSLTVGSPCMSASIDIPINRFIPSWRFWFRIQSSWQLRSRTIEITSSTYRFSPMDSETNPAEHQSIFRSQVKMASFIITRNIHWM